MQGTGIGRNIVEIMSLLIAVALISMFVRNSRNTTEIIKAGSDAFGGLLETATGAGYFGGDRY